VNLKNLTLSRLFYYQALRIVERAVLPTAIVCHDGTGNNFCKINVPFDVGLDQ
jgi:hypothetical protein